MTDLLLTAAKRLGIPTETSAGSGASPATFSIWARWPRHPREIAQDVLNAVCRAEGDASVSPSAARRSGAPAMRGWTHIGRFEDAVAHWPAHVAEHRNADEVKRRSRQPSRSGIRAWPAERRRR